mgnify:CR=1 FL=1
MLLRTTARLGRRVAEQTHAWKRFSTPAAAPDLPPPSSLSKAQALSSSRIVLDFVRLGVSGRRLDALAAAFAVDVLKMARRDGRGRGKRARDAADDAWERLGQAASSPSSLPATGKQRWQSKRRHVPGWFAAAGRRVSGLFRAASSPGGRGDAS